MGYRSAHPAVVFLATLKTKLVPLQSAMILILLTSFLTVALPAYGLLFWGLARLADGGPAQRGHAAAPRAFAWHARQ